MSRSMYWPKSEDNVPGAASGTEEVMVAAGAGA